MTSTEETSNKKARFSSWTFDKPCTSMAWSPLPKSDLLVHSIIKETTDDLPNEDLIIIGVLSSGRIPENVTHLDEVLEDSLSEVLGEHDVDSKKGKTDGEDVMAAGETLPTIRLKKKRYVLIGLGKGSQTDAVKIGSAISTLCHSEKNVSTCSVHFPKDFEMTKDLMTDISCAFYSGLYADNRFRTGDLVKLQAPSLTSVKLIHIADAGLTDSFNSAISDGYCFAKGLTMAKDIVNAPHNVLNSLSMADTARRIAEESGGALECRVLDKDECEKRGMGAYLGVARGSETPPQFIHLIYRPKGGEIKRKVGIVGKGLCFDTGGYNIKVSGMELMKFDCGGAAATLGGARAIASLAPEGVEAHFITAACENMISKRAYVPSDILTASNGKTIEVLNTDAEGRLTLADALVYADQELKCDSIIELSTLTGACMVSLGKKVAGVWTCDDDLAADLNEVAKATGEKTWRMPMEKEYNEHLKSKIADVQNLGTRYGGAIQAALFLQNFVEGDKPFAHLDIAGPVWDDKTGATGYGSKTVTEWVRQQGK